MTESTPGWQPDPTGKHDHRYWDGSQWTDNISDAGVAGTDPYEASSLPGDEPTVVDPIEPVAPADTTAPWPTAPAPGAPAPPPPYVPTATDGNGGSGSKKGLLVGGAILAAVAIAVIAFLALGGDDDDGDDVRADLASKLEDEADGSITSDQAECVADLLVDEAGEDAFKDIDFGADDPPQEVLDAFINVGPDQMIEKCDIDEAAFTGDSSTDGSTDSTDTTGGGDGFTDSGELPDNFEEQLTDIYEESFDLDRDKAECLAGKLTGAIEEGSITQEEVMSEFINYLSDCDISMEEMGAN